MAPFLQTEAPLSSKELPHLLHAHPDRASLLLAPALPSAKPGQEEREREVLRRLREHIASSRTLQLTSLGPTGLVILDLLERGGLLPRVPVVFIDTLHHFEETYALVEQVRARFRGLDLRVYRPKGCETREEFEARYGENLWERMPSKYAYYSKVEPRDRALSELGCSGYINGRRKSQGNRREQLSFLEYDEELGISRVQPLFDWSYDDVWGYIRSRALPYNALHDQGYKSIGDVMTTSRPGEGEGERAGRWKGSSQTECGLHLSPSELKNL